MLDLETLGTRPGSAILAIGAVKFNEKEIYDSFYCRISLVAAVQCGLTIDPETVLWWMQQSDEARRELCQPADNLPMALIRFAQWVGPESPEMWGNGAAFDNVLLAEAYRLTGQEPPWKFYDDRCYRTVKNLYPDITIFREGTHHHALEDARSQACHLIAIMRAFRAGRCFQYAQPRVLPVKEVRNGFQTEGGWQCDVTFGIAGDGSHDDPTVTWKAKDAERYPMPGDSLVVYPPQIAGYANA